VPKRRRPPGAAALTARDPGLQEVAVKLHVKTLYRKIGARNRTHAVLIAREMGLE
jgi:DNA-binding NarL/FixJ family response regulator